MVIHGHPVKLYGFDFPTQGELSFDGTWSAAFLTPRFTNEDHELLANSTYVSDSEKKREVKYGNNIAALFRTLVHLGQMGGQPQDGFWAAIARGFNTNTAALRETVDILTEARKLRQSAFAKETSETARAADQWIEFIDRCFHTNPVKHLDPVQQIKIVKNFLASLEKKLVNEARIPLNPAPRRGGPGSHRGPPSGHATNPTSSLPPKPYPMSPAEREGRPAVLPPKPSTATGPDRDDRPVRKRSASPMSPSQNPESKRFRDDQLGEAKKSHQDSNQSGSNNQPTGNQPAEENSSVPPPCNLPSPELKRRMSGSGISSDDLDPSRQLLDEDSAMLRKRIAELRLEHAKTDGKIEALAVIDKVGNEVDGLKAEVTGMKGIMEVMMESMHTVADSLNNIKDDIAGLKASSTHHSSPGTSSLPQPVQDAYESVKMLKDEVASLKTQLQDSVPPDTQDIRDLRSLIVEQNALILEQRNRMDQLAIDMTRMQSQGGSSGPKPAPQNLRQAIAAAEQDIRHHMHTVKTFYHRLDSNPANRMSAERTADLILALEESLGCAQQGLKG